MKLIKIGSLQIEPEANSQSTTFWKIRTIILVVLSIFLIGTLFGLTGPGILDKNTKTNHEKSLQINYDYFARMDAVNTITVNIDTSKLMKPNNTVTVWFTENYLHQQYIKQILPAPAMMAAKNGIIIFTFVIDSKTATISFILEPQKVGFAKTTVGTGNASPIHLTQFFYP